MRRLLLTLRPFFVAAVTTRSVFTFSIACMKPSSPLLYIGIVVTAFGLLGIGEAQEEVVGPMAARARLDHDLAVVIDPHAVRRLDELDLRERIRRVIAERIDEAEKLEDRNGIDDAEQQRDAADRERRVAQIAAEGGGLGERREVALLQRGGVVADGALGEGAGQRRLAPARRPAGGVAGS